MNEYLLADGNNIINSWKDLKQEDVHSLESARNMLIDIMSDYCAYKGINVIVVWKSMNLDTEVRKNIRKVASCK